MTNIPSRYFCFVFTFTHHNAIPQILIDTWAIQNLGTWTTDRKLQVAQPKANLLLHCHWFASCCPLNKRTILALFMQPSFLKFLPWIINLLFESNYRIPNDNIWTNQFNLFHSIDLLYVCEHPYIYFEIIVISFVTINDSN